MRTLLIKPRARLDLIEIHDYIAADSPRAADRVIERIDATIRGLLEFPGKGHARADVADPTYRFWTVYSYVIAYRYDDLTLTVIRVVHGRRDFRRIFAHT